MINSNPSHDLRVPEFIQFGKDLLQILLDANPVSLLFNKQFLAYKSNIDDIAEVYKISLSNPLTQTLIELDDKRDNLFSGMCLIVDGNAKGWLTSQTSNAALISDSIEVFGRKIIKANYQSESASLSSLIDNWEKDANLKAALIALNLDIWKTELYNTNELFKKTYLERNKSEGEIEALAKIKDLRVATTKSWTKFENVFLGKIEEFEDDATKAPLYTALENNINALFDKYNTLIHQRIGRLAKKLETPVAPK